MKRIAELILLLGALSAQGAQPGKVLVVFSGVDYVSLKGGGHHPTGFFLSEFATPAQALRNAGYQLVFASPGGRTPVIDKVSDSAKWFPTEAEYQRAKSFLREQRGNLQSPVPLESLRESELSGFQAVFLPGGHAPMEDLYRNENLGRILRYFHTHEKPTALICHAPIALLAAQMAGETWAYEGYRMTVFSTAEEKQEEAAGHLDGLLTFYVQPALADAGGKVTVAEPWHSHVIRDRELITGQNPMSDHALAAALLAALSE